VHWGRWSGKLTVTLVHVIDVALIRMRKELSVNEAIDVPRYDLGKGYEPLAADTVNVVFSSQTNLMLCAIAARAIE
jgi:hypothetical protein